jgi:hypothetical protein
VEAATNFCDVMVLKEANTRNAGGAGFEAGGNIHERDAAQSEHRDAMLAGSTEVVETGRPRAGRAFLLKDRGEHGEVCATSLGLADFGRLVAGHADHHSGGRRGSCMATRCFPDPAYLRGGEAVGREMDAVGGRGERDVAAAVDE